MTVRVESRPALAQHFSNRFTAGWSGRVSNSLLGADTGDPWNEALVLVLTTIISEAGHEVAVAEDEESSCLLASNVLELIARIGRP